MSQTNDPNQSSQPQSGRSSLRKFGIVGLVLVAILSLAFAGYTAQTPHITTVTQQQLLTNTQSLTNTLTITNTKITTSATTITSTIVSTTSIGYGDGYGYGYGNGYYPNYPYYQDCGASCPPSPSYLNNYNTCNLNSPAGSNTFQCYGYIFQDSGGCVELAVPMPNPPYYFETPVTHYYGLHNLPSNTPPMGSWVTVTGQWNQGTNTSPSGAACPFNYLNVTSITQ